MLKGKKILLGVTGSIAAYKAAEIVSLLKKKNAKVFVIMTESATKFIQPLTFSTLSGNPIVDNLFSANDKIIVKHISLAQWADLILIAPATANVIGKIAQGIADDMLTTTVMASESKVIFAPAMNDKMYEHPITQGNIDKLKRLKYGFVGPKKGKLACGYEGMGHIAAIDTIVSAVKKVF